MATPLRSSAALALLLVGSVAGGLACKDKGTAADDTGEGEQPPLADLQISFDEVVPTVATVTWTTQEPGTSWVSFGVEQLGHDTPETETATTEHSVVVLGLAAARTNKIQAHTRLEDGTVLDGSVRSVDVEPPPPEIPSITISDADETRWSGDGYFLTSYMQAGASYVVILDRRGNHVWWRAAGADLTITSSKPALSGTDILFAQYDREQAVDVGGVIRQPIRGGEYASVTRTVNGHHDFIEVPGNRIAWLAFELEEWDIASLENGIAVDVIYEKDEGDLDEDVYDRIFGWSDHVDPYAMCSHFYEEAFATGANDWTHGNSLMYDDYEDVFYIMAKNTDSLLKVDRSSGNVIWEMGGRYSDFALIGDGNEWWSHGHMSWVDDDEVLLFDNHYHDEQSGQELKSRASAYVYDADSMTVQRKWTYKDPYGRFVALFGDVRLMPNGNYLVSWSSGGFLNEITPDGEVVWTAQADVGSAMGRVHYLADLYDLTDSY